MGDRLERLVWLRDRLVGQISADETCVCEKPRLSQLAPLAGQLTRVLEQIDVIERAQPKGSAVDELKGRRQSRRSGSAGRGRPGGRSGDVGAGGG